jgi:alginate O-acetyltransferase complex protein AlgJ
MKRAAGLLLVAAFLATIALPPLANLAGVDGGDGEAENRTLAPFPVLEPTWASIAAFPPAFDTWFQDHFAFRSTLVRWHGEVLYFWLRTSPSTQVTLGKDGWLYYYDDSGMEDYVNQPLLRPGEVENWRNAIVRARDWCRAHGIAYLFTVLPDKHVVYPEFYPPAIRRQSPTSRADQILDAVKDTGAIVDVREPLAAAKSRERLYHLTDTHWNDRGAFAAYTSIIDAIRRQVPSVPPAKDRSAFDMTSQILEGRDLAAMIGLKRVLQEEDLRMLPKGGPTYKVIEPAGGYATAGDGRIVTEIPGSSLPRAVIFRDSFVSALAPFLSEHFSRAVYLWEYDFDADEVLKEHPDVVIQQIVGRHLFGFVPSPELVPDP